jgi:hypothetical protein
MNKKKLIVLPIVAIVVAMFGISVMAMSPCSGRWHVHDKTDKDVCEYFQGFPLSDPQLDLTVVPGLASQIEALGMEPKNFKFNCAYDVHQDTSTLADYSITEHNAHTVFFEVTLAANEYAIVIHKSLFDGTYTYNICKGPTSQVFIKNITDFSPFFVYVGAPETSPQTGEFAPAYIAMISVALISCGAIFAIRAKKASK